MKEQINLMRVSEYARLKKVSVKTVYQWVKEGKIKSRKICDLILIEQ